MSLSFAELDDLIGSTLKDADEARKKGDIAKELHNLADGLKSLLSNGVKGCATPDEAIEYANRWAIGDSFDRLCSLNEQIASVLRQGDAPQIAIVSDIELVHLAWLTDNWDSADRLLVICIDRQVAKVFGPTTRFWKEYYRAIEHLATGQPYIAEVPKVKGYEQYGVPYLRLVEDLTHFRDPTAVREEVRASFEQRNRDKRLIDWEGMDGDGKNPVQWDFREFTILKYWRHRNPSES
jgi:hypothetical protein